eukprot:CAMPEP_0195507192 /NCGR_PEP_ID=MMETSP0794_2-20130614/697_1 /TAXON_ID=515487 /ORGANISM="Stephanopyxis turris, Strain CCMP 815" /LENGTH=229 /DNA_ID=CAMNT_0040633795 /DNA_START=146 /DNA_END=832 /DNA_ORIENTATION=+
MTNSLRSHERIDSSNVDKSPVLPETNGSVIQTRWKLDLTEGYERQRRRLLPNHEFRGLYNIDGDEKSSRRNADNEERHSETGPGASFKIVNPESVDDTTALLKEMQIKTVKNIYEEDDDNNSLDGDTDNENIGDESDLEYQRDLSLGLNSANPRTESLDHTSNFDGTALYMSNERQPKNRYDGEMVNLEDEEHYTEDEILGRRDGVSASSYDLITGLLEPGDWPEKSYN